MVFTIFGDAVLHRDSECWAGSLVRLGADLGFDPQAVRVALSRMVRQGRLAARRIGRSSYYSLTDHGLARVSEGVRRVYATAPDPWDGHWRMLTYAIPESQRRLRDQLRAELVWRGFGSLASGVWLSTQAAEQPTLGWLADYGLGDHAHVFVARYGGPLSDEQLTARLWDLPAIAQSYQAFLDHWQPRRAHLAADCAAGRAPVASWAFAERTTLVHAYRKFLHIDPGLPSELVPAHWPGITARALFHDYYRLLSPAAEAHFESQFRAPPRPRPAPRPGRPTGALAETAGQVG